MLNAFSLCRWGLSGYTIVSLFSFFLYHKNCFVFFFPDSHFILDFGYQIIGCATIRDWERWAEEVSWFSPARKWWFLYTRRDLNGAEKSVIGDNLYQISKLVVLPMHRSLRKWSATAWMDLSVMRLHWPMLSVCRSRRERATRMRPSSETWQALSDSCFKWTKPWATWTTAESSIRSQNETSSEVILDPPSAR